MRANCQCPDGSKTAAEPLTPKLRIRALAFAFLAHRHHTFIHRSATRVVLKYFVLNACSREAREGVGESSNTRAAAGHMRGSGACHASAGGCDHVEELNRWMKRCIWLDESLQGDYDSAR